MQDELPKRKTDGTLLTEREIRKGMRVNILAGALGTIWVTVAQGIPLTMFLQCAGASGLMIGLSVTVQQVATAFQIPASFFAERLTARKRFWAAVTLLQRALWFLPAVLPFLLPPGTPLLSRLTVLVVAVSAVLIQIGAAPWWSWMADLIPERYRNRFWGNRQSLTTVASLVAVWVSGYVLDVFPDPRHPGGSFTGFLIVFGVGAVLGCADILVHLGVPEPMPARRPQGRNLWKRMLDPLRNRDFLRLTLSMGVWAFALGLIGPFTVLYLSEVFHLTYRELAATTIVASLGVIVSGVLWGYVMDRIGARNFGVICLGVAPLFGAAWFFMRPVDMAVPLPWLGHVNLSQPLVLLLAVNLFAGAMYSGVGLSQFTLLAALSPQQGRTVAMAMHWSAIGLMSALGPLAGGYVADTLQARAWSVRLPTGTDMGYIHALILLQMALVWLVSMPLLQRLHRGRGEPGLRTAFARFAMGNPIRALNSIYGIYSMMTAGSSRERAAAVRKLGEERTAIAVEDLVQGLDDPSADVREEAAQALGQIASPEAVDALVRKLEDPNADLVPQLARALRHTRSPRGVEALLRHLGDADREAVSEAARALGEIGDRRAVRALLRVLQSSTDAKVVSASSEALARLGEMAAIYEILPRMRSTSNRVLKRSLAVAVGDLLGTPGEFYRILMREQQERGVEVERLIDQLCHVVHQATEERMTVAGETLVAKARSLESAYEQGRNGDCLNLMFDLAVGLAALRYSIESGADDKILVEVAIWHDERFGVGVWYLDLLREAARNGQAGDDTDVLLGIYFLSGWTCRQSAES